MIQQTNRLKDIHAEALAEFDQIQSACYDERRQCNEDRRFYSIAGAQWEDQFGDQFENRPKIEVNKIHRDVIRVINEYRRNRITVDFVDRDGNSIEGMASTLDGMFRADVQDSNAEEAFDNSFEEGVGGGFGAFRLTTVEVDELDPDDDRQRIQIEPIFDADQSVFFDLDAKRQDKSDATSCYVITQMTRDAYEAIYDDDVSSWPADILGGYHFDWHTPDYVNIAEVYAIEIGTEKRLRYRDVQGGEREHAESEFEDTDLLEELEAIGSVLVSERTVQTRQVHKYIMSGGGVLDHSIIPGMHIPIVPVYGKRWFVDGIERCMGHVRLAKDPQRVKNVQISALTELAALSGREKPILTPEQVEGFENLWAGDNVDNNPYLLINPITNEEGQQVAAGPLGYTKPPVIPQALAALLQTTEADINDILGNTGEADKMVSNTSGRAVEMIQERVDGQAYIYLSNFAKAMKRCGQIWLSMARDVYVEMDRRMKVIDSVGGVSHVTLGEEALSDDLQPVQKVDLQAASKFDVAVEVGPSSESRKQATVRAITGMMAITSDPETQQVLQTIALMNMDGEGLGDVQAYFRRRLVSQGVIEPNEEEKAAMQAAQEQGQQPTPQEQWMQSEAEKNQASAAKQRAETAETVADTEKTRAETQQIQMEMRQL